ncbi:Killer toxin subunits alpha/beta 6 [Colletotrichum musicola]|uniref:chitinase n=1 Tax=Colletotrichum musicola TaxID=2175873 RepID=A0A8H6J8L2_9PEZI|nr:Killer toxin subunits alpha/beta 6 [Colletotrichum musicola]
MEQKKTSPGLLGVFSEILHQDGPSDQRALEICDAQSSTGDILGIVADPTGDFAFVQKIMRSWNEAKCVSISATDSGLATTSEHDTVPAGPSVTPRGVRMPLLRPRADCRTIQAEANDDCTKLAARCGIGKTAFASFNKASGDICSGSIPQGRTVCCSSGSLPTGTGGGGVGGVCTYYDIQADEGCFAVASKHSITVEELESFNKKTWGWDGCGSGLQISQRVCVSSGRPPLPSPDPVAVCGPAVVGTVDPGDGTPVEELNMCPLNACCSNWGYCGLTEEFCTIARLPSGNSGTSQPGKNSCLSNCGMEMTNNGQAPAQFRKVGYFQGWNYNRPCGHMHVREIDSSYTHVHFAFGEFGSDLQVFIPQDAKTQWEAFKAAKQIQKKILAFGGWDFSNLPATSGRFRQAVSGANRETFATNVVKFAVDNGIDGLDFDWEYPGATDIVGSDPGQKEDGDNYYEFLKLVRAKLPSDKSLSIATAASYWYLRGFPIKKMSEVLSYIVYMTYDLHGQWDVGNKHASPGCGAGNCLRSHINSTETYNSLVMITKAGVESHKVVVGVSSYGRSFKMADATCRGPQCTFLGDSANSPAKKGRCTGTGGYIADFEIEEIIKKGGAIKTWYDAETDSDYLVYEGTEWVAYMKPETKERRTAYYKGLNFGGTTDWAIDLQSGRNLDE